MHNFKNILKTLTIRHQNMAAYHLHAPLFFKQEIRTSRVDSVLVSSLHQVALAHIRSQTSSDTIYTTTAVTTDATDYSSGMSVSVGFEGGLPTFTKVVESYFVNNKVCFLCHDFESWYVEHLRSYELSATTTDLSVHLPSELNDTVSAYKIEGLLLLTPKRFIPVKQN